MEFESRNDVAEDEYIEMLRCGACAGKFCLLYGFA